MNAWLIHIGEDLASDPGGREYRYGYLADAIVRRGGGVVRWAPTLRHTTKTQRAEKDQRVRIRDGYDVQLVRAPGYRAHIGFRRIRMHQVLARRFRALAPTLPRPDVIVAAIPSLEWAEAAVEYGAAAGVPVVVDIRDLWPDVFESVAPRPLRPLARVALSRYSKTADRVCRGADALTAVSPSYLEWALRRAGRRQAEVDAVTPIGCRASEVDPSAADRLDRQLQAAGYDPRRPTGCYLGQFARSSDLDTVLDAARLLDERGIDLQLLLCGDGAKLPSLKHRAAGLRGVHFLGWVDGPTMAAVMQRSQFGLCAYNPKATQSWPNKPFEYMAGDLAVVSSLSGDLERLVDEEAIGVNYAAGDPASLSNRLAELLRDPHRLASLRGNAARLWEDRFRPEIIYDEFAKRLEQMATQQAQAA